MKELREICQSEAEDLEQAWQAGELFDYLNDEVLDMTFIVTPPRTLRAVDDEIDQAFAEMYEYEY